MTYMLPNFCSQCNGVFSFQFDIINWDQIDSLVSFVSFFLGFGNNFICPKLFY